MKNWNYTMTTKKKLIRKYDKTQTNIDRKVFSI